MKSDIARFTVRFNPEDPRQRVAIDVLNASGRRKASLIADALHYYLSGSGYTNSQPVPPITWTNLEKKPYIMQSPNTTKVPIPIEQQILSSDIGIPDSTENSHISDSDPDDDFFNAVRDAMNIFNG